MTYPTRKDQIMTAEEWAERKQKPRLNWLLLIALTLNLGVWVGILAWWIWR